jgi:hypothetical protein
MSQIILKDEMADYIREKALEHGYDDPSDYLLDLVAADNEEEAGTENETIRESFKRGFKQALQGKVMNREELKRRLAEKTPLAKAQRLEKHGG